MANIYFSIRGSLSAGGPTVAAARLAQGFIKRGHKVVYEKPGRADVCICIIESGKILRQVDRNKTKVTVRLDGIYAKNYWHSKTPDRLWRKDMDSLHSAVKRDIENVDHMFYQSLWSKRIIDAEILERKDNFSIINNGIDTNIFNAKPRNPDKFVSLLCHSCFRNDYIMESLIGVYKTLKSQGHLVKLLLVGGMDAQCSAIYNANKSDKDIVYYGQIPNSKLPKIFENVDIGVYPRMGSSSDNTIVEALSSSVPCVLPSWGGNASFISDGKEGIVVQTGEWDYGPDYIQKLADGVEKIIPDLPGFKKRAREHAVKELSIEKMIDKYLKGMGL